MAPRFLLYYQSPENPDYLRKILTAANCEVLESRSVDQLPGQLNSGADVVFLEYREGNPDLDQWIGRVAQAPEAPAIFLYLEEVSKEILWKALRLGVKECFAPPFKVEELSQALARLPRVRSAPAPEAEAPRLVAFLGAKGGVGNSFLAANAACLLAQEDQGKVLLVDLDLRYGQLIHFFDARPKYTLIDVVDHLEGLDVSYFQSLLLPCNSNLYLLPAPSRLEEADMVTPAHLEKVVRYLLDLKAFRWILLDCCHHLDELTLKAIEMSHRLLLVLTPTIPALANAKKLLEVFGLLGLHSLQIDLWLNSWQKKGDLGPAEVEGFLERPLAGTVQFEPIGAGRSINEGKPMAASSPGHPICRDLRAIVLRIMGDEPQAAGRRGWRRLFRKGGQT